MERYESKRADAAIEELFRLNQESARVSNIIHPVMEALGGFAIAAVILYGGNEVISGNRDAGSLFTFIFALLRSEEHTSELQSLMRISYAVFCLKTKRSIHTALTTPTM